MIGYAKSFDANMTMSSKVSDNQLLKSIARYRRKLVV